VAEVTWLGAARLVDGIPARPVLANERWQGTAQAWKELPEHSVILDVVAIEGDAPLVAYADLYEPVLAQAEPSTWLVEILEALLHVYFHGSIARWLSRPVLCVDLEHRARLGFLPATGDDPGEPAMARAAAELVASTGADVKPISGLLDGLRRGEYHNLADACRAADRYAGRARTWTEMRAWRRFERGCGYEECGDAARAFDDYQSAAEINPLLGRARLAAGWVRSNAMAQPTPNPAPNPDMPAPRIDAAELEASGRFAEARDIYVRGGSLDARLGLARCQLALDQLDDAIAIAQAIGLPAAAWIEAAARARRGDHAGALTTASRLPDDDAAVWYLRGKALLALRKLTEARAALDRTCMLAPGHTAAQLLRVEVDRATTRLYRDLGRDPPAPTPTGPHPDAVALVLAGRIDDAIALLAGRDDRDARAMVASCLMFRRRYVEALVIQEALDGRAAMLGRADCLLGLGRADEALATYDRLLDADGYDVDALEGRARALRALGRVEADAAHARALAVALVH
jgi:tetratricopeptide (TPR) repeat protein